MAAENYFFAKVTIVILQFLLYF